MSFDEQSADRLLLAGSNVRQRIALEDDREGRDQASLTLDIRESACRGTEVGEVFETIIQHDGTSCMWALGTRTTVIYTPGGAVLKGPIHLLFGSREPNRKH